MLQLLQRCLPQRLASADWQRRLRQLIPAWGEELAADPARLAAWRGRSEAVLGLTPP
jgi:malate dehydrogenase (quinone)